MSGVSASPSPAIEVRGLTKLYGAACAVRDLSFTVGASEVWGLLGHNGAGKTTVLKILVGLVHPTRGTAAICGHDVVRDPLPARAASGYLPERYALPMHWTVGALMEYVGTMFGLTGDALAAATQQALSLLAVSHLARERIGRLSKGMRQKVALSQALINHPQALLLDEPTSGLDPEGRQQVLDLVSQFAREGTGILFSTHILSDVQRVCDHAVLLHEGRAVAVGPLDALARQYEASSVEELYAKACAAASATR